MSRATQEEKAQSSGLVPGWDPFRELREWFPSRLEQLFEGFEGEPGWPSAWRGLAPPIDVVDSEDRYVITVELPGTRKEDVTVEVSEGALTIRGEKRSERVERKVRRRYAERRFGSFSRTLSLPRNADPDQIQASFRDGVLTLSIAKTAEAKPRTIAVK